MKNFIKNKLVTILVVLATIILAGVAIFTAMRLYQLRRESISPVKPESQPAAWDCKNYTFSVDTNGVVIVNNQSSRDESSQKASVYINEQFVTSFDVPSLQKGQKATLGTVQVPSGEPFNWKVVGTKDCQNSGKSNPGPVSCQLLTFNISTLTITPTPSTGITSTPTITVSPTVSPTPTDRPIGGTSPTPTQTSTPTPTNTTTNPTSTPTPTTRLIAQASPTPGGATLPNAGVALPTLISISLGILLIVGGLLLVI